MHDRLSRRKIAAYVVDQVAAGAQLPTVLETVAAYLIDTRRLREAHLVVRAIEDELALRGTVLARVTTATELTESLRQAIEQMIGARKVTIESTIDPSVIGGVRVETPSAVLDATVKHKLLALRQAKV